MSHHVRIFVYPNSSSDDSLAEAAQSVLSSTVDEVIANTSAESGYADVDYRHPGRDDSTVSDFFNAWETYVRDDSNIADSNYGCHLCVSSNLGNDGKAAGGNSYGEIDDAFVSKSWAVAGGESGSAKSKNLWIQEAMHTFSDPNVSRFDQKGSDEHNLGSTDYYEDVTPMASSYEDSAAETGYCSDLNWDDGYTQTMTSCTYRGIDATFESGFNEGEQTSGSWFEAKQINIDDPWNTYTITPSIPYPVILAKPISYVGTDPAHSRIQNVLPARNTDDFECRVEEWDYLNGKHYQESVGSLAINTGHVRNDGHNSYIQAGITEGVDETFVIDSYHFNFGNTPVVITQSQTTNGDQAIVTRVKNVDSDTFEVRVQEQESLGGHVNEDIGWLATPPDVGQFAGWNYEAGSISGCTENWEYISFSNSYSNPVFLADMQTFNGPDPAGLRYKDLSSSGVYIKIEEEQSSTDETNHASAEEVGYFVIDS